jgi:O-antigen/teichoic acid export membrane protein
MLGIDKARLASVGAVLIRPTIVAQALSALGSLILISLLTRRLSADNYGTYAAVFATYTFGNALVATTIGTRVIEVVSTGQTTRVELALRRDGVALALCALAASGTAYSVDQNTSVAIWAAVGMLGVLLTEIGNAHILGRQRFWLFCGSVVGQNVLWVGATLVLFNTLSPDDYLGVALGATAIGALVPVGYLLIVKGVRVVKSSAPEHGAIVSAVGVTNLALWLLASADRVILAHFALAALATYAALYGLLDRTFRSLANAEYQMRLPAAFIARGQGSAPMAPASRKTAALLVALAVVSAALAPTLVSIISGGKYHPALWMSAVLSLGMAAMLAAVPSFVALLAAGQARTTAAIAIVAALVDVVGNLILAPYLDTRAAAALTLCGYLIWLVGTRIAAARLSSSSSTLRGSRELSEEMIETQL